MPCRRTPSTCGGRCKPRGSCDLHAEVVYASADKRLGLKIDAKPRPDNTSIEPVAFPYRHGKARGASTISDGHVDMEESGSRARPDASIASQGPDAISLPDGRWTLQLRS